MIYENREIKSSLFADLFADDEIVGKKNFLSLYNAIHETDLKLEETLLERKTVPQNVFKSVYNDISMLVNRRLIVFIEQQSTINENMPLRLLEYYVHIMFGIIPPRAKYKKKLIKIPTPEFYVFYNGEEKLPPEETLRLSEAFIVPQNEPSCELTVKLINIQNDVAESLPVVKKCDILKQYCDFMGIIYRLQATINAESKEEIVNTYEKAVREAIKKNILSDYLKRKCTEVINMFLDPYNYELDLEVQKEEAFEDGMEKGKDIGFKDGANKKAEEDAVNFLIEGISKEVVARCVGLSLEKVNELAEKIK